MNPVQKRIQARLNRLPAELAPIRETGVRYLRYCSAIEIDDGALLIAHQPWVGPEAYLLVVYPGAEKAWFPKYEKRTRLKVPPLMKRFLAAANGCELLGVSIYGMTPSMVKKGLLARSQRQCLDIGTANHYWKHEYPIDPEFFHFGARDLSDTQLAGYFLDAANRIHAISQSGKVVGVWTSLKEFLHEELAASAKLRSAKIPEEWWH
jgi:hypothetical protein